MKAADVTAISPVATDEHLVVAAQAGSHDAFAALFRRYRPEITRYAGRILTDDTRAEDVVQETFLSALRSIAALDRPEGFKPWLYRIAHNACVDQMRRRARTEEVLFDVQVLPASDEIRLFRQAPSSHAAVALKEDFDHLRQALGDLPEAQARILVLRELEGLSYEEIAERMGISHSAVESMLFRARRSLKDEFGEISSGERCRRMRALMGQVVEGVGSGKDRRRLVRHVRSCTACRRDAFVMGLGPLVDVDRRGGRRSGLSRVAALLPLPGFLNRRSEETDQLASSSSSTTTMSLATHAQNALSHVTISAGTSVEHAATAIQKAAAVVAAAAVVGGGGFVASETRTHPAPPPAVAKHMKDSRAPGFAPARPGAVFTSPLPLSLAPLAGGPPATVLAPAQTPSEPAAPPAETTPPAVSAPATTEPETTTPPATESAGPEAPSQSFDSTSSSPEPAPEPTVEVVIEPAPPEPAPEPAPAPDPPVADQPPLVPLPPDDGGSGTPLDQQPSGDTGGSGPVS